MPQRALNDDVLLVASGDLRPAANRTCWPAQAELESSLEVALQREGRTLTRAHPLDEEAGHGFIDSQRMGMDVFASVPRDAPLIVATAAWQYSHHVLAGLRRHRGPVLTVANWSGQWPGLVGMLNLNGSLTKAGVAYDSLWSERFDDALFQVGLWRWLNGQRVEHDLSHVRRFEVGEVDEEIRSVGRGVAKELAQRMAILGVFDEGCMGMYNAIIDDELLAPLGIYKERLSQSALVAEMRIVTDTEAGAVRAWLDRRGMTFHTGLNPAAELTDAQIHEQCKMYIAAVRMAERFGCDAIGIQYQQGLKDMTPASDLVEGLLNDPDRPPVHDRSGRLIRDGLAIPHFNEVDEGAAVDALVPAAPGQAPPPWWVGGGLLWPFFADKRTLLPPGDLLGTLTPLLGVGAAACFPMAAAALFGVVVPAPWFPWVIVAALLWAVFGWHVTVGSLRG